MIYLEMEKSWYDIVECRLPDVCPDIRFSLIVADENLSKLGLGADAPCIIGFDLDDNGFRAMMSDLEQLEVDAFNTPDGKEPKRNDPDYQRYLTYGILWDILYNARKIEYTAE